jgi:hypothetical protein
MLNAMDTGFTDVVKMAAAITVANTWKHSREQKSVA